MSAYEFGTNNDHNMVTIPTSEYRELIERSAVLELLLKSKDEESWRLAGIIELACKAINSNTATESGGDDNA